MIPFFVFIFTTPEDRSPYSTDATPEITSMDSTLDEAILFVVDPFTPELVAKLLKLALLESLTPSTSTAVPKEAFPSSVALPDLIEIL